MTTQAMEEKLSAETSTLKDKIEKETAALREEQSRLEADLTKAASGVSDEVKEQMSALTAKVTSASEGQAVKNEALEAKIEEAKNVARIGCHDVGERLSREVAHFQEENKSMAEKLEGERDGRHKERIHQSSLFDLNSDLDLIS